MAHVLSVQEQKCSRGQVSEEALKLEDRFHAQFIRSREQFQCFSNGQKTTFAIVANHAARVLGFTGYTSGTNPIPSVVRSLFSRRSHQRTEPQEEVSSLDLLLQGELSETEWWKRVQASRDPVHAGMLHGEDDAEALAWLEQQELEQQWREQKR